MRIVVKTNELNHFCETGNISRLPKSHHTSTSGASHTRNLLIRYSFFCLNKKVGKQRLAKRILSHYKEIKIIPGENQEYIVFTGKEENRNHHFTKEGVITLPVFDKEELKTIQTEFLQTLLGVPPISTFSK